jgi:hypothetical protein
MGSAGADQSSVLCAIFRDVCTSLRPRRLVVLGAGTGNGFEHIDVGCTTQLTAIDINPEYLAILGARHTRLASVLEKVCAALESYDRPPGAADVVHGALIFEHTEPFALIERSARWLASGGILSTVVQLPSVEPTVTPTPFESVRRLAGFMHLVSPEDLTRAATAAALDLIEAHEVPLRWEKRFWVGRYRKRG